MHNLGPTRHDDLLVGIEASDDAGVYRISADAALVQTVDFFTPIVDDAHDWGRIAAANALSDVYAMGAAPLTALQIVCWPRDALPLDLLGDVLEGAAEVLDEARCTLLGGHSIDDPEPKYGLAVTGVAHPDDIVTNAGARPADALVLTKPLGSGIAATAIKQSAAGPELVGAVVEVMTRLNAGAAAAMRRVGVHAATDVTGFGLLGHVAEIMRASQVSVDLEWAAVPWLDGIAELAAAGVVPGGTRRNLEAASRYTDFGAVDDVGRLMLADAQTSGGLLLAVDRPLLGALLQALEDEGVTAAVIGSVRGRAFADGPGGRITIHGSR